MFYLNDNLLFVGGFLSPLQNLVIQDFDTTVTLDASAKDLNSYIVIVVKL